MPYIIDAIRSPIGALSGSLSPVRADDLAAHVIAALLQRNPQLDPQQIGDVILGCANQAGEDNRNVARMALLLAGMPHTVPGETLNRLCASGMSAVVHASRALLCRDSDLMIAGGVEQMTRAPWVMSKSSQAFGRDAQLFDTSFGWRFINPKMNELYGTDSMGMTAENLAEKYQISRQDQDLFAYHSQQKAAAAQQSGRFDLEIAPIDIAQRKGAALSIKNDEFLKPDTSIEGLAKLRPAFKPNGTVTAGNASGLNDGAAALLLASEQGIKQYDLKPIARLVSWAVVGVEPRIMGIGPVQAAQIALSKASLTMNDMDIIELNEAFAAQVLACTRAWGIADNDPRLNPNGGAIALGHPLGMSGARLLQTAALQLQLQPNKRYALCTMCIGVGQGYAVVLEKA
jgi:acetyl-CoA acyltransferase